MNRATISRGALLGTIGFAALTAAGLVGPACSDDSDTTTTTGKRITLGTHVALAGSSTFENAMGWSLALDKIVVSMGPIYYFDGAPIESVGLVRPERTSPLRGLFETRSAYAHPGHYKPGTALGEMLEASSFDLALGPADLADADAVTGTYRSATFSYGDPPAGPLALDLGANVLLIEGIATKATASKVFRLTATRADALDAEGEPRIEGCTFEELDVEEDGKVTVTIDPEVWFDQAEFDTVPDSTDGEPVDVPADDRARNAFLRGIKKSTAIRFAYSKN